MKLSLNRFKMRRKQCRQTAEKIRNLYGEVDGEMTVPTHSLTGSNFLCHKNIQTHTPEKHHVTPVHLAPSKILCRHSDGKYGGRAERRVSLCRLCFLFRSHCLTQPGTAAATDSQREKAIAHL